MKVRSENIELLYVYRSAADGKISEMIRLSARLRNILKGRGLLITVRFCHTLYKLAHFIK